MKNILLLGILVAVAGGAWYFLSSTTPDAPVEEVGRETVAEQNVDSQTEEVTQEEASAIGIEESADAEAKVFTIKGVNFEYNQSEITVQEGDTVTINFESDEGFHDWVVDEFDAATEKVRPGTPTSVTFVAGTAGTYEFYCSVGSHREAGMIGTLIVQ